MVLRHDGAITHLYGIRGLWHYNIMALWRYGDMALWHNRAVELWRYSAMALCCYGKSDGAMALCYSADIAQQHYGTRKVLSPHYGGGSGVLGFLCSFKVLVCCVLLGFVGLGQLGLILKSMSEPQSALLAKINSINQMKFLIWVTGQ